jgi:hypothetical protein
MERCNEWLTKIGEAVHSLGSVMMKWLRKAASCSDPRKADPPAQRAQSAGKLGAGNGLAGLGKEAWKRLLLAAEG